MTPRLSLCMIVKDEAAVVSRCLASVQGLVDETIVVDTGSQDATAAIARQYGAEVASFAWCDDFSAARNHSLSLARGEWILVLDADEVMAHADHATIRQLVHGAPALYALIQTTYLARSTSVGWMPNTLTMPEAAGFQGYCESPLVRLFPRHPAVRFAGVIHEDVVDGSGALPTYRTPLRVHHYGGYSDAAVNARKGALYLRLTESKCSAAPQDPQGWYELGAQYWMLGRAEPALEALRRAVALCPQHARAQVALACIAVERAEWETALTHILDALVLDPGNLCLYYQLPVVLLRLGRFAAAEQIAADLEPHFPRVPAFRVNCAVLHMRLGNYRKALRILHAVDDLGDSLVALNLGLCYRELRQAGEARRWLEVAAGVPTTRQEARRILAAL